MSDGITESYKNVETERYAPKPAGQRWTRERPTESGWYWMRDTHTRQVDIALITLLWNGEPNVAVVGHIYPKLIEFDCEFQGPLTPNEATE